MKTHPSNFQFILLSFVGVLLILGAVIYLIIFNPFKKPAASEPTYYPGESAYLEIPRVSLKDARQAFDDKSAIIIDVRDLSSYDAGHIPGALSIPASELGSRLGEFKKDEWIITYCT
ncbi:MAG: rhodanese-like domain-containing protein [Omnitrophica WOR_2 bacterium]